MKQLIGLIIVLILGSSTIHAEFITSSEIWAQQQGMIADTSDLNSSLSRAESAQLFLNLTKQQRPKDTLIQLLTKHNNKCDFNDIKDHPYQRTIITACNLGVIRGTDGNYNPDTILNAEDGLRYLFTILYPDQTFNDSKHYIQYAIDQGLITKSESKQINTQSSLTASQIIQWTYSALHLNDHETNNTGQNTSNSNTQSGSEQLTGIVLSGHDNTQIDQNKITPFATTRQRLKRLLFAALLWLLWQLRIHRNDGRRDNLTIIEGIGPKVQNLLYVNGIDSYEELSRLTYEEIHELIDVYGDIYKQMNTRSRPHQAKLAHEGRRQELEILKQELVRGS